MAESSPPTIRLVRDLQHPIAQPRWPEGICPAPFSAVLAPQVHALLTIAYVNGFGTVPADFDSWWALTRHDAEFDAGLCFVAVAERQPVGFAHCWTSSFVKDLVVHPRYRRRGIGEALLTAAMSVLHDRGKTSVALKVWGNNHIARALYDRLDFRTG